LQIRLPAGLPSAANAPEGVAAPAGRAGAAARAAPSRDAVAEAVARANAALAADRGLEFVLDPDTRRVVVRIVDKANDLVLRQVPSEEMIAIARALTRTQAGLVDRRA
jgi:flagellar protein FlaG